MESRADTEESCEEKLKTTDSPPQQQPHMSKKQMKKLAKRQRWLNSKAARKAKEKEKRKRKIQEAKESGRELGPSRKMLKANKMCDSSCKIKVVFDLSLDTLMTEQELSKTLKQLHRCYSMNRRARAPLQLYLTGFSDRTEETISRLGFKNWDVNVRKESYENIFEKGTIIYLTSDSPNVIETLEEHRAYIIGALVDHNRLKGTCYKRALDAGVGHARLPLDEHLEMKSRRVLTIDQVYLILLRISEGQTWEDSLSEAVPKRKGAVVKLDAKQDNTTEGVKKLIENRPTKEENTHADEENGDCSSALERASESS